jgi:hypothetical protein
MTSAGAGTIDYGCEQLDSSRDDDAAQGAPADRPEHPLDDADIECLIEGCG